MKRVFLLMILGMLFCFFASSTSVKAYDKYAKNMDGSWANCTYWAWEYAYEYTGIYLSNWGDAKDWGENAQYEGYVYDKTPDVYTIAVIESGNYGHVAFVTEVYGNKVWIKEGGHRGTADGTWEGEKDISDYSGFIHLEKRAPDKPENLITESGQTVFSESEIIPFAWSATKRATEYWVYFWKDGVQVYDECVGYRLSYAMAPLGSGKWSFIVRAGNSIGYCDGGARIDFVVTNEIPGPPSNIRLDAGKNVFTEKDTISFSWDKTENADSYWIYLWKDGNQIYDEYRGNNCSFSSVPLSPGKYTLIVRAGNTNGYSNGPAQVSFMVTDQAASTPNNVHTVDGNDRYKKDSNVKISWDASEDADNYWVYLWKDGSQIMQKSVGNSLEYTTDELSPGKYTLIVRAGNDIGYSNGKAQAEFIVYDTFTCNFDPNGGICDTVYVDLDSDAVAESLPVPDREGYKFLGWYTLSDGGEKIQETLRLTENITVYAHWEKIDNPDIVKIGDVDGNGEIDAKDVTILRRFLAGGWNVTINEANSDINGDGNVDAKDVTMLRRALAGGWGINLE